MQVGPGYAAIVQVPSGGVESVMERLSAARSRLSTSNCSELFRSTVRGALAMWLLRDAERAATSWSFGRSAHGSAASVAPLSNDLVGSKRSCLAVTAIDLAIAAFDTLAGACAMMSSRCPNGVLISSLSR